MKNVKIGKQIWTAKNCNDVVDGSWEGKYGRLYTWDAAMKLVPPDGFRLPTKKDWKKLGRHLGGKQTAGKKLKSVDFGGNDEYGFNALPGGSRGTYGVFSNIGFSGNWWSATQVDADVAWHRGLRYDLDYLGRRSGSKGAGLSVRFVKNLKEGV